ncbi:MAG: LPS assembly lipoprotein LptE [Candidatus Omnitrophota bacterium]
MRSRKRSGYCFNAAGLTALAALCLFAVSGCGYTTSSIVYGGAKTIFIDNFVNKINVAQEVTDARMYIGYRSGMEIEVTKDIRNEFIVDGTLKIVPENQADLILRGDLVEFQKEALVFDSADNITGFRVNIVVSLKLIYRPSGKVVMDVKRFTGESTYRTTGEFAQSEDQAIQRATEDLAARVVEIIVQGW